jgi:chromosome segregation protein
MRIERIELNGFKSFCDKTVFTFHPGFTAIVGPNGCGKSNIVDAFRWVLGEQSAKNLRGDSMEDVIFSGSATRKPKGMAEVTLVISDVNNNESGGTGEITITRRLYRSGESEYLMNKLPCRLKDIKNVFLDTGLELKTYSILEQGKIDIILNSKPHERRFLIEEVAGVMKYNVRKAEALQKLESSQSNLQRLQDIIAEVRRQINSIERHARRAQKYKQLFEEIKKIEIKIAVKEAASFNKELDTLTQLEKDLKLRETELSTKKHSYDGLIEEKRFACTEQEKSLEEIQKRVNETEKELVEEEGKVLLLKNERENLEGRLKRLLTHDNELKVKRETIISQIEEMEHRIREMESELSQIEEVLNSKREAFSSLEKEIKDLEEKLDTSRKEIFKMAEELSTLRNEINSLSLVKEGLEKRERKNAEDINALREDISQREASINEAEDEENALNSLLKEKYETKRILIEEIKKWEEELTAKEAVLYKEREEMAAITSRVDSLRELDRARKKMIDGNIKILSQVADIFEPLPEYETAIEAVLGEKLNVSVLNSYDEVREALRLIKEKDIERSGFVSIDTGSISHPSTFDLDFSEGVVGRAIEFVKIKKGFENVVGILLNNVIIVNNLNTAFEIWQRSSPHLSSNHKYLVTLDGEVIEPSGIIYAGSDKNILRIKREIKELDEKIRLKREFIISTEKEISSIRESISSSKKTLTSLDSEISEKERSRQELQLKISRLREEDTRQRKKMEYLSVEMDEDRREKDNICRALDEKNNICKVLEEDKRTKEKEMREYQEKIQNKKTMLETLRSELTDKMLLQTALKEKKDAIHREIEKLKTELLNIDSKSEQMSKERLEIETGISQKAEETAKKEDYIKSSVVNINKLKEELSRLKEILDAKTAELSYLEQQQKANIEELSSIRQELSQIEVKKTELTLRLGHLKEDVKKSYDFDLDNISEGKSALEPLTSEEEEKLPGLKERLKEIGPVSLGTLEELEELKTRYDFLTKQQEDLVQSIKSLQETISRINNTTRHRLTVAFEALNEKFKEVFSLLFGRGRAELILTEDNILEAGIEIVAQPPGKRLQNLMLLSGGEKALTAISLLFAGFMIKPTPLCLLDEVDAPLDEPNTERFTSLITELSKKIQFIAITHNRRTMEISDYIYGVTMEEPGVSKVVSMHMAEMV